MADHAGANKRHATAHKSKNRMSKKAESTAEHLGSALSPSDQESEAVDEDQRIKDLEQEKEALMEELAKCQLEKRQANYRFNAQSAILDDITADRDSLRDDVRILRKAKVDHTAVNARTAELSEQRLAKVTQLEAELRQLEANNKRLEANNRRLEANNRRLEANNRRLEANNRRLLREASKDGYKLSEQATEINDFKVQLQKAFAEKRAAEETLARVKKVAKEKDMLFEGLKKENARTEKTVQDQRAFIKKQKVEIRKQQVWLNQLNSMGWVNQDGSQCDRKPKWMKH